MKKLIEGFELTFQLGLYVGLASSIFYVLLNELGHRFLLPILYLVMNVSLFCLVVGAVISETLIVVAIVKQNKRDIQLRNRQLPKDENDSSF